MKNFRKLSALILSALASFTLLVGCGAAPVEDTTPAESAPVVPVVEKTAPEATPEAPPKKRRPRRAIPPKKKPRVCGNSALPPALAAPTAIFSTMRMAA